MKYNFIETSNIKETILNLNNVSEERLNREYDFNIKDEVFLNFKEKLLDNKDKKFLIVGDYDADGICSTVIISKLLDYLKVKSNYYIPSRIKEGYGLNNSIVEMAHENNFDVLLLVDNGIVCDEQISLAYSYGIEVMIIDHHEYKNLPKAEAIIHSNIVESTYSNLSAGGLCYLLSSLFYDDDLSLVLGGISTISDMMPVLDFNRALIKKAYMKIQEGSIYQINMLNESKPINYDSISYNIIPKINAISRMEPMGNPNYLVKYFLQDEDNCKKYLEQISQINLKRKEYTNKMYQIAKSNISNNAIELIASKQFLEGLCGLIANKILHSYKKPAIIFSIKDGVCKGSCRSPIGFDIYNALKDFDGYLSYGGHENAVGLSFEENKLNEFKEYVSKIEYFENDNSSDAIVLNLDSINTQLIDDIEALAPYGTGFKEPLLVIENNNYKKIVIQDKYPKYIINSNLSAISFNEEHKNEIPMYFIGKLSKDTYRNNSMSFTIEDMI